MLFNQVMRYLPALALLRSIAPSSILEVGCGAAGLGPYWGGPFVGCDIRFGGPLHANMRGVAASALALPFGDNAFDCVCSFDTLEHIPLAQREGALAELARVASRWVLVGYPVGHSAQLCDRWLEQLYAWRSGSPPDWLVEHRQHAFPDGRAALTLKRYGFQTVSELGNENLLVHLLGIIFETRGWFRRHAGGCLRRWPCLISLLSGPPCYRRLYLWARLPAGGEQLPRNPVGTAIAPAEESSQQISGCSPACADTSGNGWMPCASV